MAEVSSNGVIGLYIISVIYIFALYFSERNSPNKFNMIELLGLGIIMVLEFFIGFSVTKNVGTLFLAVFVTWIVIFAPTLLIYSGPLKNSYADELNSIFSNVIGYLFVANEASGIFSKLLMENEKDNDSLKDSKRLIAQIYKSQNIFINQLTPTNFNYLWANLFSPLFPEENAEIKEKLQTITNHKFVIGKCIWYFYTCILAITVSSFFMTI